MKMDFDIEGDVLCEYLNTGLTNVIIPDGIAEIETWAFKFCRAESVEISDSVKEIDGESFMCCKSLSRVVFGSGVEKIHTFAFRGCTSLKTVEFRGTIEQWEAVEGKAELFCKGVPAESVKCTDGEWKRPVVLIENGVAVQYLDYEAESAEIPENITELGKKLFRNCRALKTIKLGDNITQAPSDAFNSLGGNFEIICKDNSTTCKTLKRSPKLRAHVKYLVKEEAKDKKIAQIQQATADALIKSFFAEDSDSEVIALSSTKSATIVLVRCGANSAVFRLGADYTKWLDKAKMCIAALSDSSKSGAEIYKVIKNAKLTLSAIPKSVQSNLKLKACRTENLRFFGKGEINDIFPKNVNNVELFGSMQLKSALWYSDKLLSAVIGEDVSKIDSWSFYNCKNLSRVEISESVTAIEYEAFSDCKNVLSVVIPKSVVEIGEEAFARCKKLRSIEFDGTVAQWKAVKKGDFWKKQVPAKFVKCSDGEAKL